MAGTNHRLLLACSLSLWTLGLSSALTQSDVSRMKSELQKFITDRKVAHMMRAVFHDCIGGCDGCLNRDHKFNSGLPDTTNWINTVDMVDNLYDLVYKHNFPELSRADFYIVSAEAGLINAVNKANQGCNVNCIPMPKLKFYYGRKDCSIDGRSDLNRSLPTATLMTDQVFQFYGDNFGLTEREAIALQGAGHTLGGATGVSGWRGFWKGVRLEGEIEGHKFDNGYFKNLVSEALEFVQERVEPIPGFDRGEMWQWYSRDKNGTRVSFALNSDLALVKDIKLNERGKSSCTFDTCDPSPSVNVVREFAQDPDKFIKSFESAWEKMVTSGTDKLYQMAENDDCRDYIMSCKILQGQICTSIFLKTFCKLSCEGCKN